MSAHNSRGKRPTRPSFTKGTARQPEAATTCTPQSKEKGQHQRYTNTATVVPGQEGAVCRPLEEKGRRQAGQGVERGGRNPRQRVEALSGCQHGDTRAQSARLTEGHLKAEHEQGPAVQQPHM